MKMLLTVAISLSLSATTFAQECPYSKAQQQDAATCSASQDKATCQDKATATTCCATTQNSVVQAFQKLDAASQKEVATAMAGMSKLCPMGKRMPETMVTLDRLYAASIAKLDGIVKSKAPEAFRKDAAEQLAMVKQLAALNSEVTSSMTALTKAASECCMAEGAKKDCDSACAETCTDGKATAKTDAKTECQSTCSEQQGCPVSATESLCKSWSTAGADLAAFNKCEDSKAKMSGYMAVLAKHKIDPMPLVMGNLQKEAAILKAGAAKLVCPKGGLMARNAEVMSACEASKGACEATVTYMTAANKLLGTMSATMAGAMKGECSTECSGEKTECSTTKTECSGAKTECSSTKTECSTTKTECSTTKGQCPSSRN